jgi:hypothetical protein
MITFLTNLIIFYEGIYVTFFLFYEVFVRYLSGGYVSVLFVVYVEQIVSLFNLFLCHRYAHYAWF